MSGSKTYRLDIIGAMGFAKEHPAFYEKMVQWFEEDDGPFNEKDILAYFISAICDLATENPHIKDLRLAEALLPLCREELETEEKGRREFWQKEMDAIEEEIKKAINDSETRLNDFI